ncbi:thioesterase II family protein [Streptomyces sp. NPDC001407]|uniref:thioesterase II family protein n=1 Tax=Streptomyces sp. NPDC001407 TaxID=3364573 RepID=UPI003682AAA4
MKNPWLLRFPPRPGARVRLVCLPGAGSPASLFHPWSTAFPESVEVCAVRLPGRGGRLREAPFRRMEPLADALAEALRAECDRPLALFGHSLGALVAYEVAARLRHLTGDAPAALFVAAHKAPQLGSARVSCHDLPDDELLAFLGRIGGTPPPLLARPEIRRLALPALRADFELDFTYTYRERPPLDIPVSAFGGRADAMVTESELDAWEARTGKAFLARRLPGGHFFLTGPAGPRMLSLMRGALLAPDSPASLTPAQQAGRRRGP